MVNFTIGELADMHFTYGVADGNAYKARRIYQERYPNRVLPGPRTFSGIHRRLHKTGNLKVDYSAKGVPETVRIPELEGILHEIEEDPETSTTKIAATFNILENPLFDKYILFTDEANFSRNSIQNFHNNHTSST